MTKREKRLRKGIESLEKQKKIHEEKRKMALELGQIELVRYYDKEIKSFEERKRDRGEKLRKD